MKINEFLEKGLLIKSKSTEHEIQGSLAIAEQFLEKAKGTKKIKYYDVAFSLAYQSMFHAARALLFNNNLKERSHVAMISAVREIYSKENAIAELIDTLDSYRMTRHAIQYTGAGCNEDDASEAIRDAEKFLEEADKILSK